MAAVRSAVQPAATPAGSSAVDSVDLVNVPGGQTAQERYSGAVDPSQYGPGSATVMGSVAGPVAGNWPTQPFGADVPVQAPGGGVQDSAWTTGHDGPSVDWDSNAGAPFAGSQAVDPDLHAEDSGGVFIKQHVTPAATGRLQRLTVFGQTFNRVAPTQELIGQNAPNGRQNRDEAQYQTPAYGNRAYDIGYAERPIYNNLAYEAHPVTDAQSPYVPSGALPDNSQYSYAAVAYEQPPDPSVGTVQQASSGGINLGWA